MEETRALIILIVLEVSSALPSRSSSGTDLLWDSIFFPDFFRFFFQTL